MREQPALNGSAFEPQLMPRSHGSMRPADCYKGLLHACMGTCLCLCLCACVRVCGGGDFCVHTCGDKCTRMSACGHMHTCAHGHPRGAEGASYRPVLRFKTAQEVLSLPQILLYLAHPFHGRGLGAPLQRLHRVVGMLEPLPASLPPPPLIITSLHTSTM